MGTGKYEARLENEMIENDEEFICEECNAPLSKDDEYHVKWGTCNSYCYGKMVGVYF